MLLVDGKDGIARFLAGEDLFGIHAMKGVLMPMRGED